MRKFCGRRLVWRLRAYFLHIVLDEGLPVWFYSVSEQEAATHLGRPHSRVHRRWQAPGLSVSGLCTIHLARWTSQSG